MTSKELIPVYLGSILKICKKKYSKACIICDGYNNEITGNRPGNIWHNNSYLLSIYSVKIITLF